jgi:hypothetical protein
MPGFEALMVGQAVPLHASGSGLATACSSFWFARMTAWLIALVRRSECASGRDRNSSTAASRVLVGSDTSLLGKLVIPWVLYRVGFRAHQRSANVYAVASSKSGPAVSSFSPTRRPRSTLLMPTIVLSLPLMSADLVSKDQHTATTQRTYKIRAPLPWMLVRDEGV